MGKSMPWQRLKASVVVLENGANEKPRAIRLIFSIIDLLTGIKHHSYYQHSLLLVAGNKLTINKCQQQPTHQNFKNAIRAGGSTALYTSYTARTVYIVKTVYTIYTIQTALHCINSTVAYTPLIIIWKGFNHTSYLSFLLHRQDFRKPKGLTLVQALGGQEIGLF